MTVALTGFMGAGKTTTGQRLARILELPFYDTDAEVERAHGTIATIFAERGEAAFRRVESETIVRLLGTGSCVIALGGGAVVDPANRAVLRRHGVIVHLRISPEAALKRLAKRTHRPLLGEKPDITKIRSLMAARADAYADYDYSVSVDDRTSATVAHIIARLCRRAASVKSASQR